MRNIYLVILVLNEILQERVAMHIFPRMDSISNHVEDSTQSLNTRSEAGDIRIEGLYNDRSRKKISIINDKVEDLLLDVVTEYNAQYESTDKVMSSTDWPTNRFFNTKYKKRDSAKEIKESPTEEVQKDSPGLSDKMDSFQEKSTEKFSAQSKMPENVLPYLRTFEKGAKNTVLHLTSKVGLQSESTASSQILQKIRTKIEDIAEEQFAKTINKIYVTAVLTVNTIMEKPDSKFLQNIMKLLRVLVANIYTMFMDSLRYLPMEEKVNNVSDPERIKHWLIDRIMDMKNPSDFHDMRKRLAKPPNIILKGHSRTIHNRRTRPDIFENSFMWGNLQTAGYNWYDPRNYLPDSVNNLIPDTLNPATLIQNEIRKYVSNLRERLRDGLRDLAARAEDWIRDMLDKAQEWIRSQVLRMMEYVEWFCRNVVSNIPTIGPLKKNFLQSRVGQWILRRYFPITTTTSTTTEKGPGPFQKNTILKSLRMACDPEYKDKVPRHPFHPTMGKTIGGFIYDLLTKDEIFIEIPTTERSKYTTTLATTTRRRIFRPRTTSKTKTTARGWFFGR